MQSFAQLIIDNADAESLRKILAHIDKQTIEGAIAAAMGFYGVPQGGARGTTNLDMDPSNGLSFSQVSDVQTVLRAYGFQLNDDSAAELVRTIYAMQSSGVAKIEVIKNIRNIYGYSLKTSKDLVDYLYTNKNLLSGE